MAEVKEQLCTLEECEAEVDNILDDMGVGEEGTVEALEIRAATRAFIIKDFKAWLDFYGEDEHGENKPYPVGEAGVKAWAFVDGYETCLKRYS